MAEQPILLGALVNTDLGQGFVMGCSRRAKDVDPFFDVRLLDGRLCRSYEGGQYYPRFTHICLLDNHPIDHPALPNGLRQVLRDRNLVPGA